VVDRLVLKWYNCYRLREEKQMNPFRAKVTEADKEFAEKQKRLAAEAEARNAETFRKLNELKDSMTEAEWEAHQAEQTAKAVAEFAGASRIWTG